MCFRYLPRAVQVDLTRVQLDVLLLIKDAINDGLQHLMQIQHANSLPAKPYHMLRTAHLHTSSKCVNMLKNQQGRV